MQNLCVDPKVPQEFDRLLKGRWGRPGWEVKGCDFLLSSYL